MKNGRRLGHPPKPYVSPDSPLGEVNVTDPDSRVMKAFRGCAQGYNVQTSVNEQHIALAGEITAETIDFGQLRPMIQATLRELEQAGVSQPPPVALADAGYWNEQNTERRDRRAWDQRAHPPGLKPSSQRAARMDRRALQLHAPRPDQRRRESALPQAQPHGRAGVRSHQATTDTSTAFTDEADQRSGPSGG